MSLSVRKELQTKLLFQNVEMQRYQLTEWLYDENRYAVHTNLIYVLDEMATTLGLRVVVTALRDDHSPDGCLGPESHNPAGMAVDFWLARDWGYPIAYVSNEEMIRELPEIVGLRYIDKVGLGGCLRVPELFSAFGTACFSDNDTDHAHIQVHA